MKLVSVMGKVNFHRLDLQDICIWFSYETPIAFQRTGQTLIARQNDWKQTTGKHLNYLEPDHKRRIDGVSFMTMLQERLNAGR